MLPAVFQNSLQDSQALAFDVNSAQALKAIAARGDVEALGKAARQFEAMLVTQMLRTMRETRFNAEDDPLDGGEAMKLYRGLLDQQWATQIASGRGLGFADAMTRAMRNTGNTANAGSAPIDNPGTGKGG